MLSPERVQQLIKEIGKSEFNALLTCKVIEVNEEDFTCDVDPLADEEPIIYDVKLNSDLANGISSIPKVGSIVTVAMLNENQGVVVQFGDIDKHILTIGKTQFTLDDAGIDIKSDGDFKLTIGSQTIEVNSNSITFNKGLKGSLVNINLLSVEVAKINANFALLQTAISNAQISPADGGALFKTSLLAGIAGFQPAIIPNTANNSIKQ